jgi:hypothetical protein
MKDTCVILGSAPCLASDLATMGDVDYDLMAINRAGIIFHKHIKWWATYHADGWMTEGWHLKRKERGGNMDFITVIHKDSPRMIKAGLTVQVLKGPRLTGSSSLFGTLFALGRGYARVILAGAPLDHPLYAYFRNGWKIQTEVLRGRVFSLSGWTRDFLEGLNHA